MELRYYLEILRRRRVFLLLCAAVALVAGWLITPRNPVYQAQSTVYIGLRQFDVERPADVSFDRIAALDRLAFTFASMVDSRPVAQKAIDKLKLDRSASTVVQQTQAYPQPGTQLLRIQVDDRDPGTARDLANALATSFAESIRQYEGPVKDAPETGDLPSGLPAYVYELAALPQQPAPNGLLRNLGVALAFGLLAGAAVVLLVEYLDITVKSSDDVEHRVELAVFGLIPFEPEPLVPIRPTASVQGAPLVSPAGPERAHRAGDLGPEEPAAETGSSAPHA